MKKFVCIICGYVHEGDCPPEKCPICGAGAEKFGKRTELARSSWAAEHRRYQVLQKVLTLRLLKVLEKTSMVNVQKLVCTLGNEQSS